MGQVVIPTQVDTFFIPKLCRSAKCLNDPVKGSYWCSNCLSSSKINTQESKNIPKDYTGENITLIYFITTPTGHVKIGKSKNLKQRLAQLQSSSPVPLTVAAWFIGEDHYEEDLHELFDDVRSHGEWFTLSPEIQKFIDKLNAGKSPSGLACSGKV